MKNRFLGAVLVVMAVIAIGGYVFPKASTVIQQVGSVVGPDTYFPYVANNDLRKYDTRKGYVSATTTVCAIKSPNATSTLVFGSAQFTTSSTTASTVTLAKATTAYATTTVLNSQAVSAGAQATIMASSSPLLATGAINDLVFAPATYFVVGMAGNIGTFSPVGTCEAEFIIN